MGNDDNDGSDAPDWSLVEGFRTGGDKPTGTCQECGRAAYRFERQCYTCWASHAPFRTATQ